MPSWSIEVKRISPVPRSAVFRAQEEEFGAWWARVWACGSTIHRSVDRLVSDCRHDEPEPYLAVMESISAGFATAALLLLSVILSAPAFMLKPGVVETDEMPPPTVNGIRQKVMRETTCEGPASLLGGADVEVDQFVGPFGGIYFAPEFHGVADFSQPHEVDA